ncbi:hypothetical protein F4859DRAFT_487414 [Xylaria cf. heliscus]|nr:hypothetical protein F4859DRAFT_487414 [Xylaria cf. heliscus]
MVDFLSSTDVEKIHEFYTSATLCTNCGVRVYSQHNALHNSTCPMYPGEDTFGLGDGPGFSDYMRSDDFRSAVGSHRPYDAQSCIPGIIFDSPCDIFPTTNGLGRPTCCHSSPCEETRSTGSLSSPSLQGLSKPTIEGLYLCNICHSPFTCPKDLERHTRSVHTSMQEEIYREGLSKPTIKGRYLCNICHSPFTCPKDLERHTRSIHTNMQEEIYRQGLSKPTIKGRYPCNMCPSSFVYPKDLKRHTRSVHTSMQEEIYRCRCGKSGVRKDNYLRHVRTCNRDCYPDHRCRCGNAAADKKSHIKHVNSCQSSFIR